MAQAKARSIGYHLLQCRSAARKTLVSHVISSCAFLLDSLRISLPVRPRSPFPNESNEASIAQRSKRWFVHARFPTNNQRI